MFLRNKMYRAGMTFERKGEAPAKSMEERKIMAIPTVQPKLFFLG
jgi:hypothetical protein